MEPNNMTIRAGARLTFSVYQADPTSVSATFTAQYEGIVIEDTVVYTDGVAVFQFDSPDTDVEGVYEYQVAENFPTGSPDIYPNGDNCDGDCDLPTLEICRSLQEES